MVSRPVAGGGRRVMVPPERLERWLAGFEQRHGEIVEAAALDGGLRIVAHDGAVAACMPAFPPLTAPSVSVDGLIDHVMRDRRIGLLLVRLGGHAAGIFVGRQLVSSKVGSRQVHGRSAAGGWSQQRFARRRVGQVAVAQDAAAEVAIRILLPEVGSLDAVVTGGDRTALAAIAADRRLASLKPLVVQRILDVADPRQDVLKASIDPARSVEITIHEP